MIMSNSVYDILNKIQRWLPALGVFYLAMCQIWGFQYGDEVNKTILAVTALLAATLEISTGKYHAAVLDDLIQSAMDEDEADEDEAQEDAE